MTRYTTSKDGTDRTTVILRIRLTREEVEAAKLRAADHNLDPKEWRDHLESLADLCIEAELWEYEKK